MDISSWDGTLTLSEFSTAANSFSEKWNNLNPTIPPWSWVSSKKQPWISSHQAEGYLSLEKYLLFQGNNGEEISMQREEDEDETICSKDEEEPIDDATLVHSGDSEEEHYYDFHIVYSYSYRVPVLYFRAYATGGQPLVLDKIEKDLPSSSTKILLESKWTFITMEEHPYLNRPWYKLHPCGTSEWMKLLFLGDHAALADGCGVAMERYLVAWFSVVGQVFGLRTPFEMLNKNNQ